MEQNFRHSHVAIKQPLILLAKKANKLIYSGEDDLGAYLYFELFISDDKTKDKVIRILSHEQDGMSHIFGENTVKIRDVAVALVKMNVNSADELSISTNQNDQPLLDVKEIQEYLDAITNKS